MKALGPLASCIRDRRWSRLMKALDPLASCIRDRRCLHSMKALGPLAVAERDILVRFAHSDSARSDD